MSAEVTLSIDPEQMQRVVNSLATINNGSEKAIASAINGTVDSAASSIRTALSSASGIPKATIGNAVRSLHTRYGELTATIRILNFNVPLLKSTVTPDDEAHYALKRKTDAVEALPNRLFFQVMPKNGHLGYFVRQNPSRKGDGLAKKKSNKKRVRPKRRNKRKDNLPISELYVNAPRKVWEAAPAIANEELNKAWERLSKNIESQIDRLLAGQKAE